MTFIRRIFDYSEAFIHWNYLFALAMMMVALTSSKFFMSVSEFWLLGVFLLQGMKKDRFIRFFESFPGWKIGLYLIPYLLVQIGNSIWKQLRVFFQNKPALIFSSLFLLHLLGLLYTPDFSYAFKDLRTKLPLLILPIFFAALPKINRKTFGFIMLFFIGALLLVSIKNISYYALYPIADLREISSFISHIIFGILMGLGVYYPGYFIFRNSFEKNWIRLIFVLIIGWFIFYLILSESVTGIIISIMSSGVLLLLFLIHGRSYRLIAILSLAYLAALTASVLYIRSIYLESEKVNPIDLTKLDSVTALGNPYVHNLLEKQTENGYYLWIFISWEELRSAWNSRSNFDFDGVDQKKQVLKNTLVRFLTSKGLRKDAEGVNTLTDKEILAIESGIANVKCLEDWGIRNRIRETIFEIKDYQRTHDPSGHSLIQRMEFWRASIGIIGEHPWIGVGTGDMNVAFQHQYEKMNTMLAPDQRWRSHNQFLSITVGFGLIGLTWFLLSIFVPVYLYRRKVDFFFTIFLIFILLAMLTEDTIESQAGVTLYAFFYCFFLFGREAPKEVSDPLSNHHLPGSVG